MPGGSRQSPVRLPIGAAGVSPGLASARHFAAQVTAEPVFHLGLVEAGGEQGEQLAQSRFAGHTAAGDQPGITQRAAGGIDPEIHMAARALADRRQHHALAVCLAQRRDELGVVRRPVPLP